MTFYIAPIVEGHTEADCVERLLQRVWGGLLAAPIRLKVLQPSRCKRDAFVNPSHPQFAEKIEEAYTKLMQRVRRESASRGLILLLLDAENDCPATLGPQLLAAARTRQGNVDISCVLAKRMMENWLVAGCATLGGVNGLPKLLTPPADPDGCHGAGWLKEQLRSESQPKRPTKTYKKTVDAALFIAAFDLDACRATSRSFQKLCKELELRLPLPPPPPDPPSPPETQVE
jgi:hypothetical protein